MEQRIEHDTMGEVAVPADKLWGAQTQRSFENFPIGEEKMPPDLIHAFGVLKEACAAANHRLGTLDTRRYQLIQSACQAIRAGELAEQFPLSVWQTGSGTQTNMNCNEVIAHVGNAQAGETLLHPNDHVNLSQSSNDTFPSALHIAAVTALHTRLEPALTEMLLCLQRLGQTTRPVKTGRTHLQDAVPITFGQEISGWRSMLEHARDMIRASLAGLYELALGGTAVGTGLNAPPGFDAAAAEEVARLTGLPFRPAPNKFHALSARDGLVFSHGALKALA
ncbi:MAG: lyase family protein, partial [Evtepia gabavorous]